MKTANHWLANQDHNRDAVLRVLEQAYGRDGAKLWFQRSTGTVREGTGNAIWGMQFVWPIKAEYVIVHDDDDYQQTIVGRSKRDYVWLMARTPAIPEADYAAHMERIRDLGYDISKIRRVPQSAADPARVPDATRVE